MEVKWFPIGTEHGAKWVPKKNEKLKGFFDEISACSCLKQYVYLRVSGASSGTFGRLPWSDGPQFFARHGPRTLLRARPGVSTDVAGAALGSVVPGSLGSVQTKGQF